MIIDCISDLHGHYPELEGGDLLIVAGDLTRTDDYQHYKGFFTWLNKQDYKRKVVICGNHDGYMQYNPGYMQERSDEFSYLCDSGTEFEGLKIWGSPWTKRLRGMNPDCIAFTVDTDEELAEKWALIPEDTDILVTHGPPYGIFDEVREDTKWGNTHFNVGSPSLLMRAMRLPNLTLFVFGHIHEGYGTITPTQLRETADRNPIRLVKCRSLPFIVNASHVNERYEPVNKPIRIKL